MFDDTESSCCVKSVYIRSYFGPYCPAFGLNTDQNYLEYGHFLRSKLFWYLLGYVSRYQARLLIYSLKLLRSRLLIYCLSDGGTALYIPWHWPSSAHTISV